VRIHRAVLPAGPAVRAGQGGAVIKECGMELCQYVAAAAFDGKPVANGLFITGSFSSYGKRLEHS